MSSKGGKKYGKREKNNNMLYSKIVDVKTTTPAPVNCNIKVNVKVIDILLIIVLIWVLISLIN